MIDDSQGMSFTEFSYQLLQGYDFWHLLEKEDCVLQVRIGEENLLISLTYMDDAVWRKRSMGKYNRWNRIYQAPVQEVGLRLYCPSPHGF